MRLLNFFFAKSSEGGKGVQKIAQKISDEIHLRMTPYSISLRVPHICSNTKLIITDCTFKNSSDIWSSYYYLFICVNITDFVSNKILI